jgi:pimeloyl-ACP methyl ester carboxylesterase
MSFVKLAGGRIEYLRVDGAQAQRAPIVLLHEGVGSVATWRDFPQRLATSTGRTVIANSRFGYGRSAPVPLPRPLRYMHDEALDVLPRFLDALGIGRPILFGHSDGASIALIHAGGSGRAVTAVIAMAPHVFVEDVSVASIAAAREAYEQGDLRERLARYHEDVDTAFRGWNAAWLDPGFRHWNIEEYLPRVTCPVLAIQGDDDEYGTMEQVHRIVRAVRNTAVLSLANCAHSPQRDQPEAVLEAVARFVAPLD